MLLMGNKIRAASIDFLQFIWSFHLGNCRNQKNWHLRILQPQFFTYNHKSFITNHESVFPFDSPMNRGSSLIRQPMCDFRWRLLKGECVSAAPWRTGRDERLIGDAGFDESGLKPAGQRVVCVVLFVFNHGDWQENNVKTILKLLLEVRSLLKYICKSESQILVVQSGSVLKGLFSLRTSEIVNFSCVVTDTETKPAHPCSYESLVLVCGFRTGMSNGCGMKQHRLCSTLKPSLFFCAHLCVASASLRFCRVSYQMHCFGILPDSFYIYIRWEKKKKRKRLKLKTDFELKHLWNTHLKGAPSDQ